MPRQYQSIRGRLRRTVRRSYVDLPVGQVHLRSVEGAAPAIVFLHQTASASSSFQGVLERLQLPNRLIAIDTPGFGGSFDPPGWPSIALYARWLLAVLERLRVGRFHLFGQHTGANLALEIERREPQRVRSLMLLGAPLMSAAERRQFRAEFEIPLAPVPDGSHLLRNWNYARQYNPSCELEIVHGEVVNMVRAWCGRAQAYRAVSFHDLGRALRRSSAPLLLLSTPEDYFHPRLGELCKLRPDARVSIVGGENFPTLCDVAGVANAVRGFVKPLGVRRTAGRG